MSGQDIESKDVVHGALVSISAKTARKVEIHLCPKRATLGGRSLSTLLAANGGSTFKTTLTCNKPRL